MTLYIIITIIQTIVAAALVAVVLMQRSEGGGLGIGGSPSGALGARGAADFLTRSTKWLAIAFVSLSILLAALAVNESSLSVDTSLDVNAPAAADPVGENSAPAAADDLLAETQSPDEAESAEAESSDDLLAE